MPLQVTDGAHHKVNLQCSNPETLGTEISRGSKILLNFHEKPSMKHSFRIATGWGDALGENVHTVTPAQRFSFKMIDNWGERDGTNTQSPFGHALTTAFSKRKQMSGHNLAAYKA
jgi:hypothetical protein